MIGELLGKESHVKMILFLIPLYKKAGSLLYRENLPANRKKKQKIISYHHHSIR